jgi:hypothetical protein
MNQHLLPLPPPQKSPQTNTMTRALLVGLALCALLAAAGLVDAHASCNSANARCIMTKRCNPGCQECSAWEFLPGDACIPSPTQTNVTVWFVFDKTNATVTLQRFDSPPYTADCSAKYWIGSQVWPTGKCLVLDGSAFIVDIV